MGLGTGVNHTDVDVPKHYWCGDKWKISGSEHRRKSMAGARVCSPGQLGVSISGGVAATCEGLRGWNPENLQSCGSGAPPPLPVWPEFQNFRFPVTPQPSTVGGATAAAMDYMLLRWAETTGTQH